MSEILPQLGPVGGYLVGAGVGLKYAYEFVQRRRDVKRQDATAKTTDAATANKTLIDENEQLRKTIRDEREDNRAKDARIDQLEEEVLELRTQLIDQRAQHAEQIRQAREEADSKIRAMQEQVADLTWQLGQLQRQLGLALPDPEGA